jgi:hypothetical protein
MIAFAAEALEKSDEKLNLPLERGKCNHWRGPFLGRILQSFLDAPNAVS